MVSRISWTTIVVTGLALLLTACGAGASEGVPVDAPEDIAGSWRRTKGLLLEQLGMEVYLFIHIGEDGRVAPPLDTAGRRYAQLKGDLSFDGTELSFKQTEGAAAGEFSVWEMPPWYRCLTREEWQTGVYEAQLLENDNLRFIKISDECAWRVDLLAGAEWEPVP